MEKLESKSVVPPTDTKVEPCEDVAVQIIIPKDASILDVMRKYNESHGLNVSVKEAFALVDPSPKKEEEPKEAEIALPQLPAVKEEDKKKNSLEFFVFLVTILVLTTIVVNFFSSERLIDTGMMFPCMFGILSWLDWLFAHEKGKDGFAKELHPYLLFLSAVFASFFVQYWAVNYFDTLGENSKGLFACIWLAFVFFGNLSWLYKVEIVEETKQLKSQGNDKKKIPKAIDVSEKPIEIDGFKRFQIAEATYDWKIDEYDMWGGNGIKIVAVEEGSEDFTYLILPAITKKSQRQIEPGDILEIRSDYATGGCQPYGAVAKARNLDIGNGREKCFSSRSVTCYRVESFNLVRGDKTSSFV